MVRRGKKNWPKLLIGLVVLLIVLYFGWFFFMGYVNCSDKTCFDNNLAECIRTKYIGGTGMIYEYIIMGEDKGVCSVQVTLLQGELNNQNSVKLEGKQMVCDIPYGLVILPESDISNCHGQLKEGLQELIIQKLHSYIAQNIGRINLEVLGTPVILEE